MGKVLFFILSVFLSVTIRPYNISAQNIYGRNTENKQANLDRIRDTMPQYFAKNNLAFPPKEVFFRSFKYDKVFEIWLKNNYNQYTLFKTYKVCVLSGTMGPKRVEGDFQVPEGFYYINDYNFNSIYHLSLGLNYPNNADKFYADATKPGGDIYIHGNCVSTGCLPLMDGPMEEVFYLARAARENNQEIIPVHIFPVNFSNPNSEQYLGQVLQTNDALKPFFDNLKQGYLFFEQNKRLPIIMINKQGTYVYN